MRCACSTAPRRDARHAVDEAYGNIVMRVTSHLGDDHSPEMTLFVNKLNVIVKRFKALIPKNSGGAHEHSDHENSGDEQNAEEGGTQT